MNDSKYIVPMEGYRDPQGCLHTMIATIIAVVLTLILCLAFPSCKTPQPVVTETNTNTLIEREQVDSLINVASQKKVYDY